MQDNATEVTAAGIARLAGVGRAAVSNWRRRHADFPKPVGGTDTSPSFALAEIEDWLRAQGKLAEVPLRERVWQQLAGHPAGPVTALLHAASVLLLVHDRPTEWLALDKADDDALAERLPAALEGVLTPRFGHATERALPTPAPNALLPSVPLLRGAAELAAELGARSAFAFLLGRHLDANPRQYTLTPPGPAELMATLAGPATTALDPACGTGALLHAVRALDPRPGQRLYGQDTTAELAALTALRLALDGQDGEAAAPIVRTAAADTLRHDTLADVRADVVLAHPPFNERGWGHDELAYDPRWEYGFPARTESELAWVQHALARLRDGGTAVLLMPPAVTSRRSGRRIRADLLRRGALRAVIALPAGAVPPNNIPLHLWVLRRPAAAAPAAPELLLVDTTSLAAAGDVREKQSWTAVRDAVLDAWRTFDRAGALAERPGLARSVPVIELLDDEVDLAPARRLPPPAAAGGTGELTAVRERLTDTLRLTTELTPKAATHAASPARWPQTTIGELARAGALTLRSAATSVTTAASGTGGHARVPALTDHDVLTGTAPSGTAPDGEPVVLQAGDVVVPVVGGGATARVIDEATAGAALGRGLALLRPDPAALDPWFLAGFLRGTANNRQASSYASTATRLDVRRLQLPRLPLAEQARYGARFRTLAAFEDALRLAGRLGEQLVQGLHDGLTDGVIEPE
ncbi:N-6 DNA methylase [Streptomyces kunmingensis]|uniref:N-6 DNA methylase n=1 Tax=Streptomyces kunmingensis TaxID=68225 RepID=A0ABU6CJJ3_9ACTN|nr:N-6 DNA methylase [Streptomyces kunmingensis]MEB3964886.1 N-6 DNA methylase [Streptomyces kunmingensis]